MLDGELEEAVMAFQFQFLTNVCTMVVDGPEAQMELVGNLMTGLIVGKHTENAVFGRTEPPDQVHRSAVGIGSRGA